MVPHQQIHIDRVESVQRRFLRLFSNREDTVHPPIGFPQYSFLSRQGMNSLKCRRECLSVVFAQKLIIDIVKDACILEKLNFDDAILSLELETHFIYLHHERIH